ncbi:MAG: hypothetical protein ACW98F_20660, partial [Candidatus Hodarchaeales archaeon]
LILQIPAFYTNWGRYAQLAGQAILPISLWLCWEALEVNRNGNDNQKSLPLEGSKDIKLKISYRLALKESTVTGIVLAGMILTYYRMPFYFGTFLIAWLIVWGIGFWKISLRQWGYTFIRLFLILIIFIILLLPWAINLASSELVGSIESGIGTSSPYNLLVQEFQDWKGIDAFVSPLMILMILLTSIISLILNPRLIATIFLWFFFLLAYLTGKLIGLPGANMIQNFAVVIAAYMPISLLLGWLIGFILERISHFHNKLGHTISIALVIFVGIWGAWNQRNIINERDFALVTRPDVKAMEWISDNTPLDAICFAE